MKLHRIRFETESGRSGTFVINECEHSVLVVLDVTGGNVELGTEDEKELHAIFVDVLASLPASGKPLEFTTPEFLRDGISVSASRLH